MGVRPMGGVVTGTLGCLSLVMVRLRISSLVPVPVRRGRHGQGTDRLSKKHVEEDHQ